MREQIIKELTDAYKAGGQERGFGREVWKIRKKYALTIKGFISLVWGDNPPGANVNLRDFEAGITQNSKYRKAIGELAC